MTTLPDIAIKTEIYPRRLRRHAKKLGLTKIGRDYILTDEEVKRLMESINGRLGKKIS